MNQFIIIYKNAINISTIYVNFKIRNLYAHMNIIRKIYILYRHLSDRSQINYYYYYLYCFLFYFNNKF